MKIKHYLFIIIAVITVTFSGCGNSIDKTIGEMESIVEKYEKKGDLSSEDCTKMQLELAKAGSEEMKQQAKDLNAEQIDRLTAVSEKLTEYDVPLLDETATVGGMRECLNDELCQA